MDTVSLRFELSEHGESYFVRLSCDGFEPAEEAFELDLRPDSRLAKVNARIEAGYADLDHLRDVGSQLWAGLLAGAVLERFDQIYAATAERTSLYYLRLALPGALRPLPWETCYDEGRFAFLASHRQFSIVHEPPAEIRPPALADRPPGPLSVLAVIPEGSGLSVGHEWRNLRYAVEREEIADAIRLERLDGLVTPGRLAEALEAGWDVVHFSGHGQVDRRDTVSIRLNDETSGDRELWVEAETFAAIFAASPVRLAVLNCCLGAYPSPTRSLSGLGPYLVRSGVPAVVAMRYEIQDDDALRFANTFYLQLLAGEESGRVDRAVEEARQAMYLNHRSDSVRGFVTPVVYLAPGGERIAHLDEPSPSQILMVPPSAPTSEPLPGELVDALGEGRCVPIVGPGLLRAGATRSGSPPPGPRELADLLAGDCGYPIARDFEVSDLAPDWAAEPLFQRVCQHYLFVRQYYQLVRTLRDAYRTAAPPPALVALADWPVAGIVYTHVDGLLLKALNAIRKPVRVLNRVDQEIDPEPGVPILVHLRGTLADPESLVLSEEDSERLWEELARLSPQVIDLVHRELGRSLLILGASPRDPLVRRFVNQLLPRGPTRNQGPIFFVHRGPTPVDDAYWRRFEVRWIDERPDLVVQAASAAIGGGR